MEHQTLGVRVTRDIATAIEAVAIEHGMLLPGGKPNMSAAARHLLELGLLDVRLRQGSKTSNLAGRVVDTTRGMSATERVRREVENAR